MNSEKNSTIPVVFATNNGYAPYLYVALSSMMRYVNKEKQYEVFILYTGLENRHIARLEGLERENVKIKCLNVKNQMAGIAIRGSVHLTVETCYRLFIADLFPQYSRVLYIDSDTLIQSDVADLYSCDLNGKTVGAVHDVVCSYLKNYYEEHINIKVEEGFNAGVIVIDTIRFREQKIKEQCIRWLEEDSQKEERRYVYMDQDVLNRALKDDVCFLDSAWNFQYMYLWRLDEVYPEYQASYMEDSRRAKIIHYSGEKKPWQHPDLEMADAFWEMARKTVYYEEILFHNIAPHKQSNLFQNHIFPFEKMPKGSRIILYGAGDVGKTLYAQNEVTNYVKILLWVDKNPEKVSVEAGLVCGLEELLRFPQVYDSILIAIKDERICREVKENLVAQGISEDKIKKFKGE